jgi:hypothetical protein
MKPARKPEAALCFLREFFRGLKTCFNSARPTLSSEGKGKGVRPQGRTPFQIASVPGTQGRFTSQL